MPEIDPKHALRVYVEFLEIPEDQCPPNYYTLLAVSKTNQDNTSIDEAAKRRSNELRRGLPSELQPAGRKILKRIARARICLLDVDAKAAYDASIGLTTRVDRPSKVKPKPALHRKSAKAGHLTPPEVSSRSNSGPNRGATRVTPSLTPQATSHRGIPPSQKPSAKTSPPEIDEFDDLMASLPDIESTLAPLPVVKVKPGFPGQVGPAQSRTLIYVVASSTLILVALIVYFLMPSAPSNIAESTPPEKVLPPVVDDSEEPPELPETEAEQTQPVIPELPLAERIVVDSPPKTETTTPIRSAPKPIEPLPAEITLPQLRSSDSALSSNEGVPVDLGEIDNSHLDKLRLSLDQPVVEGDAIARFDIVRLADAEEQPVWEIRLRSAPKEETDEKSALDDVGAGLDELVGKIYGEDSHLKFVWAAPDHMSLAEQLRNCVLCIENTLKTHRMAFRTCTLIEPVLVDFTDAAHIVKLEQESLPPLDALLLEITNLDNFSVSYEQQPTDGIIKYGDTLKIKLTDWERAAEIRVKFGGSRKKPTVVISAYYNLEGITREGRTRGGKWQRMTIKQLDGGIEGAQKALGRSRYDLRDGDSAISRLPGQIRSLQIQLNNDSNNATRIQSQLATAKRRLSKAYGMVRRANKLIPELEAKIPVLKQLTTVGNRLHQKAIIQFRIAVKMEKEKLVLLQTSAQANKVNGEEAL